MKNIREKIKTVFNDMGLKITMNDKPITRMDFLDVTFDLAKETYEQYRKPNDRPQYINIDSNHPKSISKNIPSAVNKILNEISCNRDMFLKHIQEYQQALDESGYKNKLVYEEKNTQEGERKKKKNRKRKITWFNPPFSNNLKTNLGREFIRIINKNFPKDNPLSKIINTKTVKISYSCTANMHTIIQAHNKKITAGKDNREEKEEKTVTAKRAVSYQTNVDLSA